MIVIYSLIAILIAWIWIEYFRMIDVFEKEKMGHIIIMFVLGGLFAPAVLLLKRYWLDGGMLELNGIFFNDFLYCFFKIGVVEESAKIIPFVIFYLIFKKKFNEPIDYLIYISVSALGFSALENIIYFNNYGAQVIDGRAILSTVGHMFDTSLFAYGIIYMRFQKKSKNVMYLILFFILAVSSHAFYDIWLVNEDAASFGILITILYFFYTVSIYATVLNNALNLSPSFNYNRIIDSGKIMMRLFTYYGIIIAIQFLIQGFTKNFTYAAYSFTYTLYTIGLIIGITCIRLSRFKLIQGCWEPIKLELPFRMAVGDPFGMSASRLVFQVKGESAIEGAVTAFYHENFIIKPLTPRRTYIGDARKIYMEEKIFLKNNESFYLVKVFFDDCEPECFLLKPKVSGDTYVNDKYPIVAILRLDDIKDIENKKLSAKQFKFIEWAFLKEELH